MENNLISKYKIPGEFTKLTTKLITLKAEESLLIIKSKWPNRLHDLTSHLAKKYADINKYLEATICYKSILLSGKQSKNDLHSLAIALYNLGEFNEATEFAHSAYLSDPKNLTFIKFYLACLLAVKKAEAIFEICDSLKGQNDIDFDIKYYQSQAFRLIGDFTSSINLLHTINDETNNVFYSFALADAYGETDSLKSIGIYENLINTGAKLSNIQKYNLSLHYLRSRNFDAGWKLFEYGLDKDTSVYGRKIPYNFINTYRADKEIIYNSKWTMICSEQGIGDQIMFLSVLSEATEEFSKIFYFGEHRLFSILKRSYPNLVLSNNGVIDGVSLFEINEKNAFGYIPLGSLLSRYRPDMESFLTNKKAFISVNSEIYNQFNSYLNNISNGRKIIGISWKSNVSDDLSGIKNIDFIDWLPLFDKNNLIVNLQYGDTSKEQAFINSLGLEMVIFNDFDFSKDLDIWLALSAACDGIVCVSTSLVHFAGASGQHVSVVMPHSQGHWSLGLNESESLLYPNVKIFRKIIGQTNSSLIMDAFLALNSI